MGTAQIVVTMLALAALWVIVRDGVRVRRERAVRAERFTDIRSVLLVEQIDFAARMLLVNPKAAVATRIVEAAFSSVVEEIRKGAVTTDRDAKERLYEGVRVGLLAKMTDDWERAESHGEVRINPPPLNPDGTLRSDARQHLECMPPQDRYLFMIHVLRVGSDVQRRSLTEG